MIVLATATNSTDAQKGFAEQDLHSSDLSNIGLPDLSLEGKQLEFKMNDNWGRPLYRCEDEWYGYTVTEDGRVMQAVLKYDLQSIFKATEMQELSEEQYIELAKGYIKSYLPMVNLEFTTFSYWFDSGVSGSVEIFFLELQDDCIVNSGLVTMAKDGTFFSFSGSGNRVEDFFRDYMTADEVKELFYRYLQDRHTDDIQLDSVYEIEFKQLSKEMWSLQLHGLSRFRRALVVAVTVQVSVSAMLSY